MERLSSQLLGFFQTTRDGFSTAYVAHTLMASVCRRELKLRTLSLANIQPNSRSSHVIMTEGYQFTVSRCARFYSPWIIHASISLMTSLRGLSSSCSSLHLAIVARNTRYLSSSSWSHPFSLQHISRYPDSLTHISSLETHEIYKPSSSGFCLLRSRHSLRKA